MLFITGQSHIDWILETAFDCGMEVLKIGILRLEKDSALQTRYREQIPLEFAYLPEQCPTDIEALKPDLVLSSWSRQNLPPITHYDIMPANPRVGFHASLDLAQRWCRILRAPLVENWRKDVELFS
jgi:hypothetical protein